MVHPRCCAAGKFLNRLFVQVSMLLMYGTISRRQTGRRATLWATDF